MLSLPTLIGLSIIFSSSTAFAQKPSRRTILKQGEQHLQEHVEQVLSGNKAAKKPVYTKRDIPLLGFSFEYPELWKVSIQQDRSSKYSQGYISDGDYVIIEEEQYETVYEMYIYSKLFDDVVTMDDVRKEWDELKNQPDHDNIYEYSHLAYIRELNDVAETETLFLGKPALQLEYTFSNWSKFWKTRAIMFPWGKRLYTIKYRAERSVVEDLFLDVYKHLLDSFTFHSQEPTFDRIIAPGVFSDVSPLHLHHNAISRLHTLGLVAGYDDGSYKPSSTINRAEFIKIMTSEPLVSESELRACTGSNFPDVPVDVWFAPHVCVGKARGMIAGYPDSTLRPNKPISFVEAAKIIAAFFHVESDEQGEWYTPFVRGLEQKKAIPTSIAKLSSPITRGEMAEMIYRLYDNIEGASLTVESLR